jgi:hypothetical protein
MVGVLLYEVTPLLLLAWQAEFVAMDIAKHDVACP